MSDEVLRSTLVTVTAAAETDAPEESVTWPEMLAALRETGWGNYSLFLREDGLLMGYLETEDFERAKSSMAPREVNERWQREMGDFFLQPDGSLPDRAMRPLEEVFHL